jgi:hypothetical protein
MQFSGLASPCSMQLAHWQYKSALAGSKVGGVGWRGVVWGAQQQTPAQKRLILVLDLGHTGQHRCAGH